MQHNMQLLALLHLLAITEAKRRQLASDSHFPRQKVRHQAEPPKSLYGMYNDPVPVDLNHVRKQGIVDPSTGQKEPYDALAIALRFRIPPAELKRRKQEAEIRKRNQALKWVQPDTNLDKEEEGNMGGKPPKPFDIETMQTINIGIPDAYRANLAKTRSLFRSGAEEYYNQTGAPKDPRDIFYTYDPQELPPLDSFDMKLFVDSTENWTTCDEFAKFSRFHPREVAGIVWELFYIWSHKGFPDVNRFEILYPTKKIVHDYKAQYSKHLDVKLDWKQPMLLLKTWMEFLLIAADRRGLFYAIPKTEIPESVKNSTTTLKVPHLTFRMKLVDPYLGMMICEEKIGLLLAQEGEVPPLRERPTAAIALGFRGKGTPFYHNEFEDILSVKRAEIERLEAQSEMEEQEQKMKYSPFMRADEDEFP